MRILIALLLLIGLSGCSGVRFVIDAVPASDAMTETVVMQDPGSSSSSKIAMIELTGLIADARRPGILTSGENPVGRFVEGLRRAESDRAVRAVIVRINSPGGTVTASDVLYRELMHFKESSGKPVVILMSDLAASGGYYVACAGDEIIAHPTTITGSVGVIIQTFNVSDGMRRIGISADAFTSGPNKNVGSPFAPMPEEHRQLMQGLVDEFYVGFTSIVRERRPDISPTDFEWLTDGRVVTGARAAEVGLVDRTGDLRDAFASAKQRAGLISARLVKYHRTLEYVGSAYARSPATNPQVNMLQLNVQAGSLFDQPGFYYLWDPSVY